MKQPRIREILDARVEDITTLIDALAQEPRPEVRERLLFNLCRIHRMVAIAKLLTQADVHSFRNHLRMSGEARYQLLFLPGQKGRRPGRFQAAGNIAPLCDALVSGESLLARNIAALCPDSWMEGYEFEDDFWYGRFLCLLVQDGIKSPAAQQALDRWQRSLAGEESPRLQICQAICATDPTCFGAGMHDLIREREEQHRKKEKAGKDLFRDPDRHWTERFIFVEGLALLLLAERAGIATEPEYPCMPAFARAP
ncbi:Imm49 family immunity protein [Archangium lansingense]|uniref:Imm49 family immunity protein n=1 Tax=Archangium lansingense TaxID=2995310 RepID=UPI003B8112DD